MLAFFYPNKITCDAAANQDAVVLPTNVASGRDLSKQRAGRILQVRERKGPLAGTRNIATERRFHGQGFMGPKRIVNAHAVVGEVVVEMA